MKKNSGIIKEFLGLDEKLRNAVFGIDHNGIPTIETRARLLYALPLEEATRIVENVHEDISMEFILEEIFSFKYGKKYLLNLFPRLSSGRLTEILFGINELNYWENIFNFLPIDTTVKLIDYSAVNEKKVTHGLFYSVKFLALTQKHIAKKVLNKIKPITFEKIINFHFDFGQDIFRTYVSSFSFTRIAKLSGALSANQACKILLRIQNIEKQKKVLSLLTQNFRDVFFSKNKKDNANIIDSDICLTNLKLAAKIAFVKKFPRSKQINNLPFAEKLEARFSTNL